MTKLQFGSGTLRLEGELHLPPAPKGAAVVCHPHPLYGGNMDNNVVLALDDAFRAAGYAVLRFNFRGVGASAGSYESGTGEVEDVRAAAAEIMRQASVQRVVLSGYSFGAMMAILATPRIAAAERVVVVGPPLSFGGLEALAACGLPKLFIAGDRDRYCSVDGLERAVETLPEPKRIVVIPGGDHFLGGHEGEITAAALAALS